MSESSFKEKFENFLSYVKLLAFLAVFGGAGYYFYNHRQVSKPQTVANAESSENVPGVEATPLEITTQKPSELLQPVITGNLPLLLDGFSAEPVELLPDFAVVEQAVNSEKLKPGKSQPSWQIAGRLCEEIRMLHRDRNAAAAALAPKKAKNEVISSVPRAKAETEAIAKKQQFFIQAAGQRWKLSAPVRKKKIDMIFQQLLAAEGHT